MHAVTLPSHCDFSSWRSAAMSLLADGFAPDAVAWRCEDERQLGLFEARAASSPHAVGRLRAPAGFARLAAFALLHRDPHRFALLYRLLWRLQREPRVLEVAIDRDVAAVRQMAQAVRRDLHKMKAFVRFRRASENGAALHVAWFEPEHHVVRAAAPFFVRRFANMNWAILTPEESVHWRDGVLSYAPGARRSDAPPDDAQESLWRTYYAHIFNPARLKPATMRGHMPKKYWRNLPESSLIPELIASAQERTHEMIHKAPSSGRPRKSRPPPSAPIEQAVEPLEDVREHAQHCRDCPLWKNATQTVFGEGRASARIMFVGEQPGDQEDLAGQPFVGPAGRLLDRALADAGVDRTAAYVTNAVKHFKFEPRGKRRIHKKPNEMEIAACHQWLERELRAINPDVVVALGATAARAVFGRATAIGRSRGRVIPAQEAQTFTNADILVTVHPSYLLRVPDEERDAAYEQFVADLKLLRSYA